MSSEETLKLWHTDTLVYWHHIAPVFPEETYGALETVIGLVIDLSVVTDILRIICSIILIGVITQSFGHNKMSETRTIASEDPVFSGENIGVINTRSLH